jgi:hypothetical protein
MYVGIVLIVGMYNSGYLYDLSNHQAKVAGTQI